MNLWEPADGEDGHDFGAHGVFDSKSITPRPATVGVAPPRRSRARAGAAGRRVGLLGAAMMAVAADGDVPSCCDSRSLVRAKRAALSAVHAGPGSPVIARSCRRPRSAQVARRHDARLQARRSVAPPSARRGPSSTRRTPRQHAAASLACRRGAGRCRRCQRSSPPPCATVADRSAARRPGRTTMTGAGAVRRPSDSGVRRRTCCASTRCSPTANAAAVVGPRGDIVWLCAPRWHDAVGVRALIGGRGASAVTPDRTHVWGGSYDEGTMIWRSRWVTDRRHRRVPRGAGLPRRPAPGGAAAPRPRRRPTGGRHRLPRTARRLRHHADERPAPPRRCVDGPARRTCTCASPGPATPARTPTAPAWTCTSTSSRGRDTRPGPRGAATARCPTSRRTRTATWRATEAAWQRRRPATGRHAEPARHPPQLRGAARAHLGHRRHGRRRHHQPARTRRGRPQLRLPLRLDPRPVLRRPGRRHRRGRRAAARRRGRLRRRPHPRPRRPARPRVHRHRRRRSPTSGTSTCPATPAAATSSATGSTSSSSSTPTARRCCCSPRPPGTTGSTPTTGTPSRSPPRAIADRWNEPDAGIWEIEPRAWTHSRLTAAAGLRAVAAAAPGRGTGATGSLWPTASSADTAAHALHPDGHWQRSPDDPGWTPRCCCRRCAAPFPPSDPRSTATFTAYLRRADPRRVRLPVPPRRPAAGRRRRRVPAVRVPRRAHPPPARQPRRGPQLVRHHPRRDRPAAAVQRGVRRRPAPDARQPAPGVRPRPAPGDRSRLGRRRPAATALHRT